eukprot:7389889-Prymnesium_polylepis.2
MSPARVGAHYREAPRRGHARPLCRPTRRPQRPALRAARTGRGAPRAVGPREWGRPRCCVRRPVLRSAASPPAIAVCRRLPAGWPGCRLTPLRSPDWARRPSRVLPAAGTALSLRTGAARPRRCLVRARLRRPASPVPDGARLGSRVPPTRRHAPGGRWSPPRPAAASPRAASSARARATPWPRRVLRGAGTCAVGAVRPHNGWGARACEASAAPRPGYSAAALRRVLTCSRPRYLARPLRARIASDGDLANGVTGRLRLVTHRSAKCGVTEAVGVLVVLPRHRDPQPLRARTARRAQQRAHLRVAAGCGVEGRGGWVAVAHRRDHLRPATPRHRHRLDHRPRAEELGRRHREGRARCPRRVALLEGVPRERRLHIGWPLLRDDPDGVRVAGVEQVAAHPVDAARVGDCGDAARLRPRREDELRRQRDPIVLLEEVFAHLQQLPPRLVCLAARRQPDRPWPALPPADRPRRLDQRVAAVHDGLELRVDLGEVAKPACQPLGFPPVDQQLPVGALELPRHIGAHGDALLRRAVELASRPPHLQAEGGGGVTDYHLAGRG